MEGDFAPDHFEAIRDVVSRLGVADVQAFGHTESLLRPGSSGDAGPRLCSVRLRGDRT
jgi:hypothetical protein